MARSHRYKIFEAPTLPELTAEQYNVLLLAEADRVDAERKTYDQLQKKYKSGGQRHDGRRETISIKTKE